MTPDDAKRTHVLDQLAGYFGTLGTMYAAFLRESRAGGASARQAEEGAKHAIACWLRADIDRTRTDGGA